MTKNRWIRARFGRRESTRTDFSAALLGLHPFAINVVAGLLRSVSSHTQVILATQSMTLVDYFDADQIVVVDRPDRESTFHRLDPERLKVWLEEYSLGELWEKNVLGGRPA